VTALPTAITPVYVARNFSIAGPVVNYTNGSWLQFQYQFVRYLRFASDPSAAQSRSVKRPKLERLCKREVYTTAAAAVALE